MCPLHEPAQLGIELLLQLARIEASAGTVLATGKLPLKPLCLSIGCDVHILRFFNSFKCVAFITPSTMPQRPTSPCRQHQHKTSTTVPCQPLFHVNSCAPSQVGRDNPAELKAQKLARGLARGVIDRDLKPNSEERRRIMGLLRLPPNKPLHADEKALLWRFRFSLQQETRALTKFLQVGLGWVLHFEVLGFVLRTVCSCAAHVQDASRGRLQFGVWQAAVDGRGWGTTCVPGLLVGCHSGPWPVPATRQHGAVATGPWMGAFPQPHSMCAVATRYVIYACQPYVPKYSTVCTIYCSCYMRT